MRDERWSDLDYVREQSERLERHPAKVASDRWDAWGMLTYVLDQNQHAS